MDLFIKPNPEVAKVLSLFPSPKIFLSNVVLDAKECDTSDPAKIDRIYVCTAPTLPETCPTGILPVVVRFPSDAVGDETDIVLQADYKPEDPRICRNVLEEMDRIRNAMLGRVNEYQMLTRYLEDGYAIIPDAWLAWYPDLTESWKTHTPSSTYGHAPLIRRNRQWLLHEAMYDEFRNKTLGLLGLLPDREETRL